MMRRAQWFLMSFPIAMKGCSEVGCGSVVGSFVVCAWQSGGDEEDGIKLSTATVQRLKVECYSNEELHRN